ncbi:hypothetical protein CBFG_01432 [Clostridiales bacterium 1_7_47FAA]|nr:hypothetical protein CBFG_01432 [Clostridiales bacterium 1_7_47FAA]
MEMSRKKIKKSFRKRKFCNQNVTGHCYTGDRINGAFSNIS